jgi:hypothetical protein
MGFLTGTPTRNEEVKGIEALAAAEIVGELKRLGVAISGLRDAVQNNVLATETCKFPGAGASEIHRTYPQNFRSVAIHNNSQTQDMVVANGPPMSEAPTQGIGVHIIPQNSAAVVNMQGSSITFYGNGGETFSFQLFDKTQPPSFA